jgi:hypothetical protein
MGEYATRRADGQKIKIGVCEDMFYLRIEDADAVAPLKNNVDASVGTGLRFRLPYPDEDALRPGEYEDFDRGFRLYRTVDDGRHEWSENYVPAGLADAEAGYLQLRHEASGLLLSVPCHHGECLPDTGPNVRASWNGKGYSIELYAVKRTIDGVFPIVRCRHCKTMWRDTWADVLPFVADPILRERLARHDQEVKP